MNTFKARVTAKNQLTDKLYELVLDLRRPIVFKPGQCVGFHVNRDYKRLYSIASLPGAAKQLSFCIDISPAGRASKFVLSLEAGDQFEVEGPYGIFTVEQDTRDLLFVATGAGVAPFKAIIPDLLQKGFNKKITLLFGARDVKDLAYKDFFGGLSSKYLNFEYLPALSQPQGEWPGIKGRVSAYLQDNAGQYSGRVGYICGSNEMVRDVRTILVNKGFSPLDVKTETFM